MSSVKNFLSRGLAAGAAVIVLASGCSFERKKEMTELPQAVVPAATPPVVAVPSPEPVNPSVVVPAQPPQIPAAPVPSAPSATPPSEQQSGY